MVHLPSWIQQGATLVDLGCGPGYTTLDLAQIVGSEGKVIAVDRDSERSLPLLKAQAEVAGFFNNKLPGLLHFAGLDIEINVVAKAVRATTNEWLWPEALSRNHLPALVKEGFLAHSVFDDFLAEWEAHSKKPDTMFFSSPIMEVVGRRS